MAPHSHPRTHSLPTLSPTRALSTVRPCHIGALLFNSLKGWFLVRGVSFVACCRSLSPQSGSVTAAFPVLQEEMDLIYDRPCVWSSLLFHIGCRKEGPGTPAGPCIPAMGHHSTRGSVCRLKRRNMGSNSYLWINNTGKHNYASKYKNQYECSFVSSFVLFFLLSNSRFQTLCSLYFNSVQFPNIVGPPVNPKEPANEFCAPGNVNDPFPLQTLDNLASHVPDFVVTGVNRLIWKVSSHC